MYISIFLQHEIYNSICSSWSIIVWNFALIKKFDGWESADLLIGSLLVSIDSCNISYTFECFGSFLVFWSEITTMSAPLGIEFDKPDALLDLAEIGGCELFDRWESVVEGLGGDDECE